MKKAREIVIPEDRPLTWDEFEDFRNHARSSSTWYTTEYSRSEKQVIDKLLKKGYTREPVNYLDEEGKEQSYDILEAVLLELKNYGLVNDSAYARALIERYADSRRGANYIRGKLRDRGIDSELASELLEELADDERTFEAIESLAERFMRSSTYTRQPDQWKRRQKLLSHLMARGFSFSDVQGWEEARG